MNIELLFPQMNTPRARHPVTPIVMGLFFAIATAITLVTGFSLLWPGSALDAMWRIKPEEHQQLLRAGLPAAVGFVSLAAIMAITSVGAFLRRRWAWWLAMIIFIINGIGDAVRGMSSAPAGGVIGVAIVAVISIVADATTRSQPVSSMSLRVRSRGSAVVINHGNFAGRGIVSRAVALGTAHRREQRIGRRPIEDHDLRVLDGRRPDALIQAGRQRRVAVFET